MVSLSVLSGTIGGQLEPDPMNPNIAAFIREIGFVDQLGSGVRKLMKYACSYGGSDPQFEDGNMFPTLPAILAFRQRQSKTTCHGGRKKLLRRVGPARGGRWEVLVPGP